MGKDEESTTEECESLQWKADLAMKARDSFYARQSGTASLRRLVYGGNNQEEKEVEDGNDETVGGLFTVVKARGGVSKQELNSLDCTVWRVEHSQDWERDEVRDRIKDCFVTGQWAKGQDAEELIKLDDEDDVYGDFEDLETGEVVSGEQKEEEEELPRMVDLKGERDAELAKRKERMERKLKLKKSFDTEYDGGEGDKDPTKDRVAVVLDHKERKVQNAFKMLREMYGQKQITSEKEKKKRVEDFIQKKNIIEEKKMKRQKEARKQISRMLSKNKAKQERMANRKGGKRLKD